MDAEVTLRVQPGKQLEVNVRSDRTGQITVITSTRRWWTQLIASEWTHTLLAILVAGVVLLAGLTHYPMQVIPAEVYPSLRAAALIQNEFKGADGSLLPAFLSGATPNDIGTGAYLQVLPTLFRPNTLLWIRAFNALLGLLAGILLIVWLRVSNRVKYPWLTLLFLAASPAWFTFTRSGLDIALAASLSLAALSCYGIYRSGRGGFIVAAAGLAMLAFYAAPTSRLAVPVAMVLLLLVDGRYHWQQRRWTARAAILAVVLYIPSVRFFIQHPSGLVDQYTAAGSFFIGSSSFIEKAGKFVLALLNVINPLAWFFPNPTLPPDVQTGQYAALPFLLLPFVLWGAWIAIKSIRKLPYPLIWIGLASVGVGAAPFGGNLPEILPAVPLLIILAVLGVQSAIDVTFKRVKRLPAWLPGPILLVASGTGAVLLLLGSMNAGTRWTVDYGREGIQFGAPQIFAAAKSYAISHPQRTVFIWPEWSGDPDALRQFFTSGMDRQIQLGFVDSYLYSRQPDLEEKAFLLPADQSQQVQSSGKFNVTTITAIPYPNGQSAFDLVELSYTPQLEQILAQEAVIRHELVSEEVQIGGQVVTTAHSVMDIGTAANLFDGNFESLVRTAEANPLVVELTFPQPEILIGLAVQVGAEPIRVNVSTQSTDGTNRIFSKEISVSSGIKTIQLNFGEKILIKQLRIEVLDTAASEPAHVHVWEIELIRPPE